MTDVDGREVSIVSPYDKTVGATVLEESVQVWVAQGWTVGTPESPKAEAPAAPAADPAPQAAPTPAPAPSSTPSK